MKKLFFILIVSVLGMCLIVMARKDPAAGEASKVKSRRAIKLNEKMAIKEKADKIKENQKPLKKNPSPEMLRDIAFSEENPDFTYPARKKRYFYKGLDNEKYVVLSFDDGPNSRYTRPLLDILKEKKVPATFYLLGKNVRLHPEIVREIIEAGSEVGNHSFTHPNMRKITPDRIREELKKTQEEIKKACGVTPGTLRFPYGVSNEVAAKTAFDERLDIFFWSIDTNDYKKNVTKDDIVKTIKDNVKGGSIILMHDKSMKVVDAVREIIDPIREMGYEFITCSDLAARKRMKKYEEKNKIKKTD
jgi:peptidoglycan-N-acetylglucosamine deacetylase